MLLPCTFTMSTQVTFEDEAEFIAAIADVRSDTSNISYAICGHVDQNPNLVRLFFTGTDNSEIPGRIDPTQALYGLARYELKVDMSTTVKFVYIHWVGEKIPFGKRGRYGVVQGNIAERFSPYHASVDTSTVEDLEEDKIVQMLMETSFTKSKVLESEVDVPSRQMRGFTSTQLPQRDQKTSYQVAAVASKGGHLEIQQDVYETVTKVRIDTDPTKWMLAGYQEGNPKGPVICLAAGEGGLSELKERLDDSLPMYGLYRDDYTNSEGITSVKFVYIMWVGAAVKPIVKAKLSTHKGGLEEIFCPAHVTVYATEQSEIDEDEIMKKIKHQG